jgi:hypothetical protein
VHHELAIHLTRELNNTIIHLFMGALFSIYLKLAGFRWRTILLSITIISISREVYQYFYQDHHRLELLDRLYDISEIHLGWVSSRLLHPLATYLSRFTGKSQAQPML